MEAAAVALAALSLLVSMVVLAVLMTRLSADWTRRMEGAVREDLRTGREESAGAARDLRQEVASGHKAALESLVKAIGEMGGAQAARLDQVARQLKALTESNETRLEGVRTTLENQMRLLQDSNEKRLDQMRQTVDEKLQSTLEKRLGDSFKLVSERLEAVQRGLGEMQSLATGVGDLKRVLTNVKARGTWAEVQLGAILEQTLAPDQYVRNVHVRESSPEAVEYAVRLPGPGGDTDSQMWLPIDSKFPQEDYLRLLDAADDADPEAVQKATAGLLRTVSSSAKDISHKYICPPATTDFAIMFLPTEGLYAEVLRQPGLVEELQGQFRVVPAGPTTMTAILSSLRMGFQTVALEKRAHEVQAVLAAVKTEFGKFGSVLARVKKQLNTVSRTIDQTEARTRAMERALRDVQQLPEGPAAEVLSLEQPAPPDGGEDECQAPD